MSSLTPITIAFEGLDGTGKSTLVQSVKKALEAEPQTFYRWVYASKEPGSPWAHPASEIRSFVLESPEFNGFERELLFNVDANLHRRFIENQGRAIVLSDRGFWSHRAYLRARLKTKQMDYDQYSILNTLFQLTCFKADTVIYLEGDLDLMKERNQSKTKDMIEKEDDSYFRFVLETYHDLILERTYSGDRFLKLDARESVDVNTTKVVSYLKEAYKHAQLQAGCLEVSDIERTHLGQKNLSILPG